MKRLILLFTISAIASFSLTSAQLDVFNKPNVISHYYSELVIETDKKIIYYNKVTHEVVYFNGRTYKSYDQYKNVDDPLEVFHWFSDLSREDRDNIHQLLSESYSDNLDWNEEFIWVGVTESKALVLITNKTIYWITKNKSVHKHTFVKGVSI